ncbi:glycine cleavage system protein GcvH [Amycolatopsis jiangsuensis]|uniref:Glycine cleavage system H protein n=1 Tax=Amycolatopsis jiangsuensis TaxID=1181879 RepID=A0A840IWZ2_9PSEU|nr:glycine cleavage system protein GcvH [Amycolatopsis jiangsuensis]MBB4685424.1 glycine cleavage system H protein [Amycolatopsis jiangsuensis]
MSVPENLSYTKEHEWLSVADGVATVGITAFAAESLGDIVFVQLPAAGDQVTAGEVFGEVESTKSVSELYSPVSGEVVEANETTRDSPEIVNSDPYTEGWLVKVRLTGDVPELLDATAYAAFTQEG